MGSTLCLFAKVARVLLLMGLAFPLNALAVKYCTDVMAFPGELGEMSFEVVTDDASATAHRERCRWNGQGLGVYGRLAS